MHEKARAYVRTYVNVEATYTQLGRQAGRHAASNINEVLGWIDRHLHS